MIKNALKDPHLVFIRTMEYNASVAELGSKISFNFNVLAFCAAAGCALWSGLQDDKPLAAMSGGVALLHVISSQQTKARKQRSTYLRHEYHSHLRSIQPCTAENWPASGPDFNLPRCQMEAIGTLTRANYLCSAHDFRLLALDSAAVALGTTLTFSLTAATPVFGLASVGLMLAANRETGFAESVSDYELGRLTLDKLRHSETTGLQFNLPRRPQTEPMP